MENDLKDLIIEEYYLFFTQEDFFPLTKINNNSFLISGSWQINKLL